MNRCTVCGTLNAHDAQSCKHCNHPLVIDTHEKKDRSYGLIMLALFPLFYGGYTLIRDFVIMIQTLSWTIRLDSIIFVGIGIALLVIDLMLQDREKEITDLKSEIKKLKEDMENLKS